MARRQGCDVLVVVTGAPYASDLVTTVFRLVDELLRASATVKVWSCGYATLLTQASLGDSKPKNILDWARRYPSTADLIAGLLAQSDQLTWETCSFCGDDRGAVAHLPSVRVRTPSFLGTNVARAKTTIYVGGA